MSQSEDNLPDEREQKVLMLAIRSMLRDVFGIVISAQDLAVHEDGIEEGIFARLSEGYWLFTPGRVNYEGRDAPGWQVSVETMMDGGATLDTVGEAFSFTEVARIFANEVYKARFACWDMSVSLYGDMG